MKLSWPKMIVIAYLTFMGGMIFMVAQSFRQTTDLEYDDYYQREVTYQEKIDAIHRVKDLKNPPEIILQSDTLFLDIPAHLTGFDKGNWRFYHVSDESNDYHVDLESPQEYFLTQQLNKGKYRMEVSWENNGVLYFYDEEFDLLK